MDKKDKHTAHTSWAHVYDKVYEQSFGSIYQSFTETTLREISKKLTTPGEIVDFGAGTGRLAVPLQNQGYQVTAVDPCAEMLNQITSKPKGREIELVHAAMKDFDSDRAFDMALCVFTVISYILDADSLEQSIQSIAKSLRVGGLLLIEIPPIHVFEKFNAVTPLMSRTLFIDLEKSDTQIYRYSEKTLVEYQGELIDYSDDFQLRFWEEGLVVKLMKKHGLELEEDLDKHFAIFGSRYLMMKKQ